MSTLWHEELAGSENVWRAQSIVDVLNVKISAESMHVLPFGCGADVATALLVPPGHPAWVNGEPVVGGLRILNHRDEILVANKTFYYSAHEQPFASVFTLAVDERRPRCPVCRMSIDDGQHVVRCPQCSRFYHQFEAEGDHSAKHCWTHRAACGFCGHPTELDGQKVWRPDEGETHV